MLGWQWNGIFVTSETMCALISSQNALLFITILAVSNQLNVFRCLTLIN